MTHLLNQLFVAIGGVLGVLLNLLPQSPFQYVLTVDSNTINAIAWIMPLREVVALLQAYVVAVALYYGLRIALRWLKVAGG